MTETAVVHPWAMPLFALLLAAGAVGFAVVRNAFRRRKAEAELLTMCHGDADMAERLIAFEQDRTPGQNREEAASAACYALRRDNQ